MSRNPLNYLYFEFNHQQVGGSRVLRELPRNAIIHGVLTIRIEEGFDGGETILRLGTDADNEDIAVVQIGPKGIILDMWPGERENYMQILVKGARLNLSMLNTQTPAPTLGRGWGVIQWLDLNLVEGFKRWP